ncbi:Cadmium efflux system accessory protein [hydrothermal vent metagenome]|uniref:Cadmium efflux system accessory protein n=1 Tax=hydrothermal vent metagenome TaxID=652676 RepID=A0A3B0UI38_9ZZZZ
MHNHSNEKTMSSDICDITIIHQDVVDRVAKEMAKSPSATTMADFLKALSDPTRLKVIQVLRYSELCVCDLTSLVGISISGLSHQLRYLRNKNIVKFRKEGKLAYYSLADDHVGQIIDLVSKHISE